MWNANLCIGTQTPRMWAIPHTLHLFSFPPSLGFLARLHSEYQLTRGDFRSQNISKSGMAASDRTRHFVTSSQCFRYRLVLTGESFSTWRGLNGLRIQSYLCSERQGGMIHCLPPPRTACWKKNGRESRGGHCQSHTKKWCEFVRSYCLLSG